MFQERGGGFQFLKLLRWLGVANLTLFCLLDVMCRSGAGTAFFQFINPFELTASNVFFVRCCQLRKLGLLEQHSGVAKARWLFRLGFANGLLCLLASSGAVYGIRFGYLRFAVEPGLIVALALSILTFSAKE
jgi:hypothetical protein